MQILSAAAIAGLDVDLQPFEFGVTNKTPEFVNKFPHAKIPTFEGEDGFTLPSENL
jgi:elongation factor 1-gamma